MFLFLYPNLGQLHAYNLQDEGRDTVDANLELGLPIDSRDYSSAIGVLRDLEIESIRLITNNPTKIKALKSAGINVRAGSCYRLLPKDSVFFLLFLKVHAYVLTSYRSLIEFL